jgi:hypothetical protein
MMPLHPIFQYNTMSTNTPHEPLLPPSKKQKRSPYQGKPVNFDGALPHRQSAHSIHVTVGALKAERLRVRNERRIANGLPPIQ